MFKQQTPQSYFFKVGEAGRQRLEILNNVCNNQSIQFLQEKGLLKPGIRILELGCGIGSMAASIAEQILPDGIVDAVDNSEEQLCVAKVLLKEKDVRNVNLINMSVLDLSGLQHTYAVMLSLIINAFTDARSSHTAS